MRFNTVVCRVGLGFALASGLPRHSVGGELLGAMDGARVLYAFETGGIAVSHLRIGENTVACHLDWADSSAIVAWDLDGKPLFRIAQKDSTFPDVDSSPLGQWLVGMSERGSYFAISSGDSCRIVNREGWQVAALQPLPAVVFSPNCTYFMLPPMASSCEGYDLAMYTIHGLWTGFYGGSHSNSYAEFVNDTTLAVSVSNKSGIYHIPSGMEVSHASAGMSACSEESNVYAYVSPRADRVAVMGDMEITVFGTKGDYYWHNRYGAEGGGFAKGGDWLYFVMQSKYGHNLGFLSLTDTTRLFFTELIPSDAEYWEIAELQLGTPTGDTIHLVGHARGGQSRTFFASIDLAQGRLIESFELPDQYFVAPGRSDILIRQRVDNGTVEAVSIAGSK